MGLGITLLSLQAPKAQLVKNPKIQKIGKCLYSFKLTWVILKSKKPPFIFENLNLQTQVMYKQVCNKEVFPTKDSIPPKLMQKNKSTY